MSHRGRQSPGPTVPRCKSRDPSLCRYRIIIPVKWCEMVNCLPWSAAGKSLVMSLMELVIYAGLGLALVLALLALVIVIRLNRQLRETQRQQTVTLSQLKRAQMALEEIRSANVGMGEKLLQLEQRTVSLANRQEELAQQDPESRLYSRALKMVELGADINEVIRECEIPRAEAELLFTMHRQRHGR